MSEARSAVIVPLPEATATVDAWRERTCIGKPSIGVPPHVTLLAPFVPLEGIDEDVLHGLRNVLASRHFALELRELGLHAIEQLLVSLRDADERRRQHGERRRRLGREVERPGEAP